VIAGPRGDEPAALVRAALAGERRAIARLVTRFEDDRAAALGWRRAAWAALDEARAPTGRVIGVTGAPGVGKSTLVGALARAMIAADAGARIAILAIDPSSPLTGGALLGDRIRIGLGGGDDARVYVRSQPSAAEPGGLGRATYQAARALARLFPTLVVETVGVGQGELEIAALADRTYLVLTPHAGDALQFMKAGIMEVPDAFVVNKADLVDAADVTIAALTASLRLGRASGDRPVHRTSARTGDGVDALAAAMLATPPGGLDARAPRFFERWLAREHGAAGLRHLAALAPSTAAYLAAHGGFDGAALAFAAS
jgi:LAO/AO transport system kinase